MSDRFRSCTALLPARRGFVSGAPLLLTAALVFLFSAVLSGCDAAGEEDASGTAYLEGRIVSTTGNPLANALVRVSPGDETTLSDSTGFYSLQVEVDSTTELSISAEKDGYNSASQTALAVAGETASNVVELAPAGGQDPEEEPGRPSNILLQSLSRETIGVKESGAPEVARVTFQVADSTGRPINLDNETEVQFRLGQAPDGAFIAPKSAPTNNNGEVTVNISSGMQAGVVQIVASAATEGGPTIRSKPVGVTIHGGLPDQAHFTVGPAQYNFPGLVAAGVENTVNVIVGDQYGNPVVPGTSVYFTTSAGVIGGSVQTDAQGRGSVTLTSGEPYPERGVATVIATTADGEQNAVSDQVPIVFSAHGILKVTAIPDRRFDEPLDMRNEADVETLMNALGQDFPFGGYEFVVEDRNGNPLPGGSTVSFQAGGTEVGSSGDTGVALGDTEFVDQNGDGDALDYEDIVRGRGITLFSGSAVTANDPETADIPDLESITFSFQGPNSGRSYTFTEPETQDGQTSSGTVFYKNGDRAARLSGGNVTWEQ